MAFLIMNVQKNKKNRLLMSYFFQKTLQNEVTLEGTFINYEGALRGLYPGSA